MMGMLCARQASHPMSSITGFDGSKYVAFVSAEAHYSVLMSANVVGIGYQNLVKVACDSSGRMKPESLVEENERAKPTPAPVRIAPMKNISRISLNGPDCFFNRIPEKVKGVFEFLISESTKATVGRIYSDQPVNIQ